MKKILLTVGLCVLCTETALAKSTSKGEKHMSEAAKTTKQVEITPGLLYEQIKAGSGEKPQAGDQVSVHYVGTLTDGTKFDSSRDRGEPITFRLGVGQVIQGWDKGIAELHVGERGILTISPALGYGDHGAGATIPGGATLIFDVELVSIN